MKDFPFWEMLPMVEILFDMVPIPDLEKHYSRKFSSYYLANAFMQKLLVLYIRLLKKTLSLIPHYQQILLKP